MAGMADGNQLWRLSSRTVAENGTIVLILEGRLSHATTSQFREILSAAHAPGDVVLDLAGVDYASSAALKVIGDFAEEQAGRGRKLTVRSPSPAARLSLELAGLQDVVR